MKNKNKILSITIGIIVIIALATFGIASIVKEIILPSSSATIDLGQDSIYNDLLNNAKISDFDCRHGVYKDQCKFNITKRGIEPIYLWIDYNENMSSDDLITSRDARIKLYIEMKINQDAIPIQDNSIPVKGGSGTLTLSGAKDVNPNPNPIGGIGTTP